MKKDEIISSIVLFVFGSITTFLSLKMPIGNFRAAGTGLFPLCLGITLMLLSLMEIVRLTINKKTLKDIKVAVNEAQIEIKNVVFFLIIVTIAILLLNKIGFFIFSFFLMLLLIRTLGFKRWVFNITLSLITAVLSYFLFVQWLKIPLPKGVIGL